MADREASACWRGLARLRSTGPGGIASAAVIAVATFAAAFDPLLATYDPDEPNLSLSLGRPSGGHLLGYDFEGRDVLSRLAVSMVLEVAALRKQFGQFVAVDDVSFGLCRGRSLVIVGESGSGKTTIARMITGLERPTSGTITACGHDRSRPPRSTRDRRRRGREVQMVFQDPYTSLDPRQNAEAAIDEVLQLHHGWPAKRRRARITELTGLVGLDERQSRALPRSLSGGQRQRVAIARALAAQPAVLILDESVSALDMSIQAQILNLLADIRDETRVSYLLISHDLAVVRQLTDETLVLHRGTVVEGGPTAWVLDHPGHPYTQRLRASVPRPGWKPMRRAR